MELNIQSAALVALIILPVAWLLWSKSTVKKDVTQARKTRQNEKSRVPSPYSLSKDRIEANVLSASKVHDISGVRGVFTDLLKESEGYDVSKMKHFKLSEKNYNLIQTKEDFLECVELLSKESVIGVDIENNN